MADLIETPEILAKAAEVIVERGWHVGNYKDPSGCGVCVLGAISVAAGAEPGAIGTTESPAGAEAAVRAFEGWLEPGMDLADWNDEVAEDADEVTTALRKCAASLKAGA